MNWNQIQGKEPELQEHDKEKWGELTDDELGQLARKRDQLCGKLQKTVGHATEATEKQADEFAAIFPLGSRTRAEHRDEEAVVAEESDRRAGAFLNPIGAGLLSRATRCHGALCLLPFLISPGSYAMLSWALTFIVVALIAGVLGFGVVSGTAAWIAKVCFVVFLVLFVISLVTGRNVPPV